MRELLTIKAASKLLHTNTDYVYGLVRSGLLPALKLGSLKIAPWELEKFINAHMGKELSDLNNIKNLVVLNEIEVEEQLANEKSQQN